MPIGRFHPFLPGCFIAGVSPGLWHGEPLPILVGGDESVVTVSAWTPMERGGGGAHVE